MHLLDFQESVDVRLKSLQLKSYTALSVFDPLANFLSELYGLSEVRNVL